MGRHQAASFDEASSIRIEDAPVATDGAQQESGLPATAGMNGRMRVFVKALVQTMRSALRIRSEPAKGHGLHELMCQAFDTTRLSGQWRPYQASEGRQINSLAPLL